MCVGQSVAKCHRKSTHKMCLIIVTTLLLFALTAQGLSFLKCDVPPETVSDFNPTAFVGRWYQMYSSLIPNITYEKDGFCVVSDYSNPSILEHRVSFSILNSVNLGSPTGKLEQATGHAINDHFLHAPGEFRLTFDSVKSPLAGFFWIVKMGEIQPGRAQYPYAIVSVPFQTSLFILARDVDEFRIKYKNVVLQVVKDMGYTYFFNKPIETYQSPACNYPPSLERALIQSKYSPAFLENIKLSSTMESNPHVSGPREPQ